MAKQPISIGTVANDGTGDTLRAGADKINDNFNEAYSALGNGTTFLSAVNNNLEIDVFGKANKISFLYDTINDLPSATTYHGAIAHVHTTGALYYAHDGNWNRLLTDTSSGSVSSYSDPLAAVTYSGLLTSLADVDLVAITPDENDVLTYDGTKWIAAAPTGGSGSATSLSDLTDVSSNSPTTGQVLKWDGNQWAPAIDVTTGGSGTDADTLDGQDGSYYLNYANFVNTPTVPTELTDLGITDGTNGQVLTTDGAGNFTFTTVSGGSGEAYDQTLNTTDDVEFNSVITDSLVSTSSGSPVLSSSTTISLTATNGIILKPILHSSEVVAAKTGATGTVTHDLSTGSVFYHTSLAGDFTVNITNMPSDDATTVSLSLVLAQGTTAYIPNALSIAGVSQTIKWQGGSAPSGTADQVDVVSFTILRSGGAVAQVLGNLSSFA